MALPWGINLAPDIKMTQSTKSSLCSQKARDKIPNGVRRNLANSSNFACSICGTIPVVFHHIEEWSKLRSNDEQYLITVCDKCHRRIHGEGGKLFSKAELYEYKKNPRKPVILQDELPIEGKRKYSFFIGSIFINDGEKSNLIRFQEGHCLTSIDTSNGILKLSILGGIRDGNAIYLIKDNELVINTQDIWDMSYSGNSLKIWRTIERKKILFIDLILFPDVIIIREMNATFNGIPFKIFKPRSPQKRQVEKIEAKIKLYEEIYLTESDKIENLPQIYGTHNGIDIDANIKQTKKMLVRIRLEQDLMFDFCKNFKWKPEYYRGVLSQLLEKSTVFKTSLSPSDVSSLQDVRIQKQVLAIREKYKEHFEALKNVVVEFRGLLFNDALIMNN